jgi:hypothetical protein
MGDHSLAHLRRSSLTHDVGQERHDLFGIASVDERELRAGLYVVSEELGLLGRI